MKAGGQRLLRALTLLGLIASLGLVASLLLAAVPKLWGYSSFVIYTGSMEPTISVGSLVVGRPIDASALKEGDIVIFDSPSNGVVVTHRIVGVRQEGGVRYFQTKGDASNQANPQETQLQGNVYKFAYELPYLGYFVHFSRSLAGIVLLLILPAAGLLLSYSLQLFRPPKGHRKGQGAKLTA